MRVAVVAALFSFLLAAPAARAEPGPYGVMGDVGLPDGLDASLAYRLHDHFDGHLGLGHNSNSFGARAGAAWLPLRRTVSPYLALEGGWYLQGDTADWHRSTARSAGLDDKTLERVGYRFLNGHLGARFGTATAAFTLQAGVSFIDATAHIIKPKPDYEPPVDLYRETVVHVWGLSGRAGLIYWF